MPPSRPTKLRVSFFLDREIVLALREKAKREGVSQGELVRQALRRLLHLQHSSECPSECPS